MNHESSVQEVETLIIGAGVIGSSVAMHLAERGMTGVRVVDLDLQGSLSSSELNAGGVRATWVQPINIIMSKVTIDYFASVADEIGYRACGYLWLHPEERLKAAAAARERQLALGWPVEAWDVAELRRRVPFLDKTDGIAGAIFAPRDGLVNPNLLKNHFRERAKAKGVIFDDAMRVMGAAYEASSASPIKIICEHRPGGFSLDERTQILSASTFKAQEMKEGARVEYRASRVINCAGAWAPFIASLLSYSCLSFPVRRQISIFDCREVDLTHFGMIIDTSGVYFHSEAANGLAGFASYGEAHGVNYSYGGEEFFMENIWSALYERSTAFERLRHLTGWAGQYEVSPDECAILGQVKLGEAGRSGRVFEAHSFSGHGVMHSYAAGRSLAELITRGRFETIDVTELAADRFESGRLIKENLVI